jgi:hypothetical protein
VAGARRTSSSLVRLGIATTPTTPTLAVLVLVPAALLLVNGIAYFPARAAARTCAAAALRTE